MNLLTTRNDDDANDDDDTIKSKNNLAPPTMGGSTVLYAELIDASNGCSVPSAQVKMVMLRQRASMVHVPSRPLWEVS
jgi:hypothetical protein